ncbi:MAG: haloacid dehalogenase-like hydrolase [Verrucomicrobiae bacterium]|nr:haloacid dehalogenase-like hydrolase [Verrucomicrobiae bacterium]
MKRSRKLLLFDIDGTLVDSGGAGLAALQEGFLEAFPDHREADFPSLELGGATDNGVAISLFAHFGLEDSEMNRRRFFDEYLERLEGQLKAFSEKGKARVLPGVVAVLERLALRPDICLSVLTGNLREGARVKLRHFGLEHHFPTGAYGDDHHDRNELGPIAHRRSEEWFREEFCFSRVAVIGDTPRDIACARAFGARAVAVATGTSTRRQLEEAAPDLLLDQCGDPGAFEEALERVFSREVS